MKTTASIIIGIDKMMKQIYSERRIRYLFKDLRMHSYKKKTFIEKYDA